MLAILTYHSLDTSGSVLSVRPRSFADQMTCLADMGVKAVALRDALVHYQTAGIWPADAVVLTFDDGYANVRELALPILQRHGFTATIYLVTAYVGRRNDWVTPPTGLGTRAMLSWEDVIALSAAGWEIGAHTATHPDLRGLSPADAETEILTSRIEIETRLNRRVETFAYPFGNLNRIARAIVRREFLAGCTTVLKRAAGEPWCALPRIDMCYVRSRHDLQRLVNGQLDCRLALRRWARALRRSLAS